MSEIKGEHLSKGLPNVSKSVIKTHSYFCPYLFYVKKILGESEGEIGKRGDVGTDTHLIFAEFWKYIDMDYMYKELDINPLIELENNPVTHYFYGICMSILPEYDRDVGVLQRVLWKFSMLHASRFLYLYNLFNKNKFRIWEHFYPKEIEASYFNDEYQLYGTQDCVFKEVDDNLNEGMYLPDYKTGKVPVSILRGPRKIADESSVQVPPKFMFEIHFYGLLYFLKRGWKFKDERVKRFMLQDEYQNEFGEWHKFGLRTTKEGQKALDKTKRKYLTKIHPTLERYSGIEKRYKKVDLGSVMLGIIFLTGDPKIKYPIVVKKKFNYTSFKTVLLKINMIRQIYFNRNNNEFYLIREMKTRPEYNKYRCQNCSRNDKCLEEITKEFKSGK